MKPLLYEEIENKKKKKLILNIFIFAFGLAMLVLLVLGGSTKYVYYNISKLFPPILFGVFLYLLQQWRYYKHVHCIYHNTKYAVHPKRNRSENPPIREFRTFQNRLIYRHQEEHEYQGEIVLDLVNLRYGRGFHNVLVQQELQKGQKLTPGSDRFGFLQVITTPDKIFVEHPYIKPRQKEATQVGQESRYTTVGDVVQNASVWEKCK